MNATKSRLQRKAAAIEKTETQRGFEAELGKARRDLNEALDRDRRSYQDSLKKLNDGLAVGRKKTYQKFDAERVRLVKKYAAQESLSPTTSAVS